MDNAFFRLIILTFLVFVAFIHCMEQKQWYTPYVQSIKSWWQQPNRMQSLTRRIDAAQERLKRKGLTHTEDTSYRYPKYIQDVAEFEKVAQKYAPPKEIKEAIEKSHIPFLNNPYTRAFKPSRIKESPSIYYKGGQLNRLINAERSRGLIEHEGLNLITIPKKYIYKTKEGWRIFAESIIAGKQTPLTLEEVKQLTKFMQKSKYNDLHKRNWIRTIDGKIALIDLENKSFNDTNIPNIALDLTQNPMTLEAQQWLISEYEKIPPTSLNDLKKTKEYSYKDQNNTSIPYMKQYDPDRINFKRALRGYDEVRSQEWHKQRSKLYE